MMALADMKPPPSDIKLAIHHSNAGFHPRWVAYCEEQGIPFHSSGWTAMPATSSSN